MADLDCSLTSRPFHCGQPAHGYWLKYRLLASRLDALCLLASYQPKARSELDAVTALPPNECTAVWDYANHMATTAPANELYGGHGCISARLLALFGST